MFFSKPFLNPAHTRQFSLVGISPVADKFTVRTSRFQFSSYIGKLLLETLRCFIHRWSAPVHQNILIRIFWCIDALHRWIKQRTQT